MTTIFMSHCTSDDAFTNRLSIELQSRGYTTWVDHVSIPAGTAWPRAVEEALQQCDVMILVLSEEARQSRHVDREWQAFYDHDKPIFPVMAKDCPKPMLLSPLQHVDFSDPEQYEAQLGVLLEVLPKPRKNTKPVKISEGDAGRITEHTAPLNPDVLKQMQALSKADEAAGAIIDEENLPNNLDQAMRITQMIEVVAHVDDQDMEVAESDVMFVFPRYKQTRVYKVGEPLIIGWAHASVGKPDVDLTDFNARRHGVSRRHAMLVNTTLGLTLTDLESTNGTFVGKKRLTPNQPIRLKNKIIVRFGGLVAQIHFKTGKSKKTK